MSHEWTMQFVQHRVADRRILLVYIEQNPSRAGSVDKPWDWRWSSAQAHLRGKDDGLLDLVRWRGSFTPESWKPCLENGLADGLLLKRIREATQNGWPLGDDEFLDRLEDDFGVHARPAKRGPRPGTKKPSVSATYPEPEVAIAAS